MLHPVAPTFQDEKVKNLLSPAVNRGNLRRLNYNKTISGRGSAPDPAGRTHNALPDPRVDEEGILPIFSSPFASGPQGAPFFFWIGTPLFRPKLRPCVKEDAVQVVRGMMNCDRWRCRNSEGGQPVFPANEHVVRDALLRLPTLHWHRTRSSRATTAPRRRRTDQLLPPAADRLSHWRHWSLRLVSVPWSATLCPSAASL